MHVTISEWTRRRHEAYVRWAERNRREAERLLSERPFRVFCAKCGYQWNQAAPETGVASYFREELRCYECGSDQIMVAPIAVERLQQIIHR
jgi:predicted Zn-ribbon and HTH transcriptional regulator